MGDVVYYSQNREDIIIDGFFKDVQEGFYVDVGANHHKYDSVTHFFYRKGWHGINVEPIKSLYEGLEKNRKRDTNLNVGISDKPGELSFREYESDKHGLSTVADTMKQEHEKEKLKYSEYKIPVKTLADVLQENTRSKDIHFMKIDIEGHEYEALASNNWDEFRPHVICIESNHIAKDWHHILEDNNYEFAFFDGLNEYHTSKESKRKNNFDYVKDVLGRGRLIPSSVDEELKQLHKTVRRLDKRLVNKDEDLKVVRAELRRKELSVKERLLRKLFGKDV